MRCAGIALLLLAIGCRASERDQDGAAGHLQREDWRQQFVGDWQAEFFLDSTEWPSEPWRRPMRPEPGLSVIGALRITDSVIPLPVSFALRSWLVVDFTPLLSRPMSCFTPRPEGIQIERDQDSILLNFTPASGDCGFYAAGRTEGDSLVGTWREGAYSGTPVVGRFHLRPRP